MKLSLVNRPLLLYKLFFILLFISSGNFGLLNVLGMRREFQVILFLFIILLIPYLIYNLSTLVKKKLFWLVFFYLVGQVVFRFNDTTVLLDVMLTFLAVSVIVTLPKVQSQSVLQGIISIMLVFSLFSIVQAIIIFLFPELASHIIGIGYTSATLGDDVSVSHLIGYFGFGYHLIHLGDFQFLRLTSYASEPSVMIYSFLCPGALALSFDGWTKKAGIIILFFVIMLAFSGTIYMIMALSVGYYFIVRYITKNSFVSSLVPFIVLFGIMFLLIIFPLETTIEFITSTLTPLAEVASVFSKSVSSFTRFGGIIKFLVLAPKYPFGAPFLPNIPVGILLGYVYAGGVVLFGIGVLVFYRIFHLSSKLILNKSMSLQITGAMMYGMFTVAIFFSDYGWRSTPGFVILSLAYIRLEIIANQIKQQ